MEITYNGKSTKSKFVGSLTYYEFKVHLSNNELREIKRWLSNYGVKDYTIWGDNGRNYLPHQVSKTYLIWLYTLDHAALFRLTY